MAQVLEKIASFINEHHVMSLATTYEDSLSVCSLFYAYDEKSLSFVVASDKKTTHVQHIEKNPKIAGNILLETHKVGAIKGLQFRGEFKLLENKELKKYYYKKFPYALALQPTLWQVNVEYFKMTDNTLGFGKKLIWP